MSAEDPCKALPEDFQWCLCQMIGKHLGKDGVICSEDLIHEIAFPGKNFQTISEFLCPFHFSGAPPAAKNRVGFLKE
ncbi:hypothetical protein GH733_014847, partial [Mirounga leonina]